MTHLEVLMIQDIPSFDQFQIYFFQTNDLLHDTSISRYR